MSQHLPPSGKDKFYSQVGSLRNQGYGGAGRSSQRVGNAMNGQFASPSSQLQLRLDEPKPFYRSGDVITGTVTLHLVQAEILLGITAKIKCVSRATALLSDKASQYSGRFTDSTVKAGGADGRGNWAGLDSSQDIFTEVSEDGALLHPPKSAHERSSTLDVVYQDFPIMQGDQYRYVAPGTYSYKIRVTIPHEPVAAQKVSGVSNFATHASQGLIGKVVGGLAELAASGLSASGVGSSSSTMQSHLPPGTKLPPSFDLGRFATARWYLKVTAVKKGLLTPNERVFAPIVFLPYQSTGIEKASETTNEASWVSAQGFAQSREQASIFKKAGSRQVSLVLASPSPLSHPRASTVRFKLKVEPVTQAAQVTIQLIRRVTVTVQGLQKVYETAICQDSKSSRITRGQDVQGSLELPSRSAPTFNLPNLRVDYALIASMEAVLCVLPITITSGLLESGSEAPPVDDYDLPPRYFDVIAMDQIEQAGNRDRKEKH